MRLVHNKNVSTAELEQLIMLESVAMLVSSDSRYGELSLDCLVNKTPKITNMLNRSTNSFLGVVNLQ